METIPTGADPARAAYPAPAAAWSAVAIFFLAQIISTMDRGMLALVVDPIRHDIRISDVQIALLQGLAFGIFYVSVGLPLGMVADVLNRRNLLAGGIVIWSGATIFGGLAQDFGHMFASRLLIGFGEAVLGPCAVTMLGDLFPPDRRGRPMAIYVLGTMVAFGIGSLVSGAILELAPRGAFDFIPFLRGRAPWRVAFILVGSLGLVMLALVLTISEPPRMGLGTARRQGSGLHQAWAFFNSQRSIFLPFYGALAAYGFGAAVVGGWGAVLLIRTYGFEPGAAGKSLGAAQIVAALIGAAVAGLLVDRVARRAGTRGRMGLAGLLAWLAIPSSLACVAPAGWLATAMLAALLGIGVPFGASMLSVITEAVPATMRGLAVALYAFVITMIGGTLGPLAVAGLTFGDPLAIGRAIAVAGSAAFALCGALAFLTRYRIGRASVT